ncbi:hypothetical protein AAFF_G00436950 [Aldrovandia affinis]|uniref:Uncharacterized protein n=1 Tax=Aldrovandia affinis TaxID=143900 RepID=A0AAD7R3H7_9TELE|nr:hypothetical protein AAFF_G00436950 [Aldrovandia affinis]
MWPPRRGITPPAPGPVPAPVQASAPAHTVSPAPALGPDLDPVHALVQAPAPVGPTAQPSFGRGRAPAPSPVPAPVSTQVEVLRKESSFGGAEVADPVASSPELSPPVAAVAVVELGGASPSPLVEAAALPTTIDPETPREWGETTEPEGAAEAGWIFKARKRPLSGEHPEARGHKEGPSTSTLSVYNRFEVLAGSQEGPEFCTAMDLELASPLSILSEADSLAVGNIEWDEDMDGDHFELGDLGGAETL